MTGSFLEETLNRWTVDVIEKPRRVREDLTKHQADFLKSSSAGRNLCIYWFYCHNSYSTVQYEYSNPMTNIELSQKSRRISVPSWGLSFTCSAEKKGSGGISWRSLEKKFTEHDLEVRRKQH